MFFWGRVLGYGLLMAISFAKVSRGRSNIILHSIVAPIVTNFGFNIICGSGVALETGTAGLISGPLKGINLSAGLLAIAPAVPMGFILSLLFLALTITFVATIRDSTGFVITTETGGKGTRQGDVAVTAVPVSRILLRSLWDALRIAVVLGRK